MRETFYVTYAVVLLLNVHQHFRDCDCTITNVVNGQNREEEVHGSVQLGARADGRDDKQVSQNCDQIHEEEHGEDEGQKFVIVCQAEQMEF